MLARSSHAQHAFPRIPDLQCNEKCDFAASEQAAMISDSRFPIGSTYCTREGGNWLKVKVGQCQADWRKVVACLRYRPLDLTRKKRKRRAVLGDVPPLAESGETGHHTFLLFLLLLSQKSPESKCIAPPEHWMMTPARVLATLGEAKCGGAQMLAGAGKTAEGGNEFALEVVG